MLNQTHPALHRVSLIYVLIARSNLPNPEGKSRMTGDCHVRFVRTGGILKGMFPSFIFRYFMVHSWISKFIH